MGRVDCGGLTGPDCRVTGIMVASAGGSGSGAEMGAARLREGERAAQLRAGSCREGRQSGAPIAVAGGYPQSRTKAARIGGMDRQTLRDWVHAHNERGFEGRIDAASGRPPKLSTHHKAEINALIEKGPDLRPTGSCIGGASFWPALPKSALGAKSARTRSDGCCGSSDFHTSWGLGCLRLGLGQSRSPDAPDMPSVGLRRKWG